MFNNNFNQMNQQMNMNPLQNLLQGMMTPQKEEMQNILNNPGFKPIFVTFRNNVIGERNSTKVQCMPYEKVSSIIEKYEDLSGDRNPDKKFIFNAKTLYPNLTVTEAGLVDNATIFVLAQGGIRGGKNNLIKKN